MDEGLLSIIPAGYGHLVKMLTTLEPHGIYGYNCAYCLPLQNCDEALPSIILAGQGILMKMLITHEPHDIFLSNFAYLYI